MNNSAAKRGFRYVPILKSKAGERWALSHLSNVAKQHIRPLIEINSHKGKPIANHLDEVLNGLREDWGTDPLYLDTVWLDDATDGASVVDTLFRRGRAYGLKGVPVARIDYDEDRLRAIRSVVASDGCGCLLRLSPKGLFDAGRLDAAVRAIGVDRSKIDILLDYETRSMELQSDVPLIPHLDEWRCVIAASGTFHMSVATMEPRKWEAVPRDDWVSWRRGIESRLPREPIYSDYTTRAPGAPAGGGNPPVHLRYASDEEWLVRVDGRVQDGDAVEIHSICKSLVRNPFFRNDTFSAGDAEISRVANPDEGSGSAMQWLQWCVNHHLEQVVDQLEAVFA